jgi:eukaryotic-like serine/threonine-protein kinase
LRFGVLPAIRFKFDEFEVDPANFQLRRSGSPVQIERIPMELLLILIEKSGQLVNRAEILEKIWGKDVFLDADSAVSTAVRKLRRALRDDASRPKYVETVLAKGYRFIAPVQQDLPPGGALSSQSHPETFVSAPAPPVRTRSYRWAAVAGAAAVVAGLGVAGWLFHSPKTHALTNKDTIVLADFANSTGDPVFDDALKQGLAVQLGQSPLLNILPDQKVRSALKAMTRSPDEALTATVAQEVCERTGSKAYIAGSIANLGGHYAIGLNAIQCTTGDALAREQIEAEDKRQVLAALSRVVERLRDKLGESLNSIQKYDVPLAQATTSSLEALKAYSFGLSKFAKGDPAGAVPPFQQAIELDPDFAIAYANLGRAYQNMRQHDRMVEALRKAFALRNRASERERFDISSVYYQFVTLQPEEAIQTCELWAQTYPLDFTPHRILGYENGVLGRHEQSVEEFRKAMELDPGQSIPYSGLMLAYIALDRLPEARAVYREAHARGFEPEERYALAFLEGDKEMSTAAAVSLGAQPGYGIKALSAQGAGEAYFGHLGRAQELYGRAVDAALGAGDRTAAADIEARAAFLEALFDNSAGARQHAYTALRLGGPPSTTLAPFGFPLQLALALALAGDLSGAKNVADRVTSYAPPGGYASKVWLPEIRAAIELKRDNPMRAVELLAPVTPYERGGYDNFLAAYLRGEAYLAEHHGQEAAVEFQKMIDHRGVVSYSPTGALARLGVARSYALQGDATRARAAYGAFLTLWKDADPGIPILIAAKSEYARLN